MPKPADLILCTGNSCRSHPAHAAGTEEQVLAEFRRVRDEIRRVSGAYAAGLREGRGL